MGLIFLLYGTKAVRWHLLVAASGFQATWQSSWRLTNIGVFLATMTPAKIGEFGRAAYLRKAGMPGKRAFAITLLDRILDTAVIAAIALPSMGVLFGARWFLGSSILTLLAATCSWFLWKKMEEWTRWTEPQFLREILQKRVLFSLLATTLLSWLLYFAWALLLARGLGLTIPKAVLIAASTIAGILNLLPIAPSGLGTRDAAFFFLLTPYGVTAEQAVALAFLMFTTIILSSLPGLLYFLSKEARGGRVDPCACESSSSSSRSTSLSSSSSLPSWSSSLLPSSSAEPPVRTSVSRSSTHCGR
jgi:uncharacterized membrane protein YbhN (UPF0104 family)